MLGFDLIPTMFAATALSATSVGVSVLIWENAGRLNSDEGKQLIDVAELDDGRVLIVWRVTKNGKEKPAYKYFAVSDDGGLTLSNPEVFRYSDGSYFFSSSSFHRLFRSSKTGKLYWLGNIFPQHTTIPGHPRYPLVIAEIDEKTLGIVKGTVTIIDTRRAGEGELLQLSNFWIIESQEEKNLEIYLTRLYENPDEQFTANVYRYTVTFK